MSSHSNSGSEVNPLSTDIFYGTNFHQSTMPNLYEDVDDILDRISSHQKKHRSDAVSRKRDEREEESNYSNNKNNNKKKAKVTVVASSVPEESDEADPGLVVVVDTSHPASFFDTLDDDCLDNVLEFVGKKCYGVFGLINKRCHEMFCLKGLAKETFLFGYASLRFIQHRRRDWFYDVNVAKGVLQYNRRDIFNWILSDQTNDGYNNLKWTCAKAIEASRLDILREVFQKKRANNNERQLEILRKYYYDPDLCDRAAQFGQLKCLKLLRENECGWCSRAWRLAKFHGHGHILEYLRNNDYPAEWQK